MRRSCSRTPGESTVVPSGSVTTGTRGRVSPPLPNFVRISWLASQPSLPGTLKRWSSASEAGPAAATPNSVRTTQPTTTSRL